MGMTRYEATFEPRGALQDGADLRRALPPGGWGIEDSSRAIEGRVVLVCRVPLPSQQASRFRLEKLS